MDIIEGEYQKKIIRLAEKLLLRKLGTSYVEIDDDLRHAGNEVIRLLYLLLLSTSGKIKEKHQKNTLSRLGGLGLWIMYKDTAYRDYFFYMLYTVLKNADVFLPLVENYVKSPDEWYVNMWHNSKERTKKLREKGYIPSSEMSEEEQIFTPVIQSAKLKKLVRE